jgi:hypothetical protein
MKPINTKAILAALPRYTGANGWTDAADLPGGYSVRVHVDYDQYMGPPWEEHDGHGPVSEWTTRDKAPGERVLHQDRSSKRYYNFAGAVRIARRDGWDAPPYGGPKGERAARAAEADFARLKAWCDDRWHWIVVGVEVSRGGEVLETDYCGGIEDDTDYWREHAADVAAYAVAADQKRRRDAATAARKESRERRYWAERDVMTKGAK